MTESDHSFDSFLKEVQASLDQPDSEAILRRINAERLLHLLAEDFSERLDTSRVRFLPDSRMVGEAGADFLFQIDDYDLRLELIDAPKGKLILGTEKLHKYQAILEGNPNTVALVLVWTTDELLAVPLSVRRIRFLLDNPEQLPTLLKQVKPLEIVLREAVHEQINRWEISLEPPPSAVEEATDLRQAFTAALTKAMREQRNRRYHLPARKSAAKNYPQDKECKVILETFERALSGVPGDTLVDELSDMSLLESLD